MSSSRLLSRVRHPRLALMLAPVAALGSFLISVPSSGYPDGITEPITRIEEDWQLVLNVPEDALQAPQLTTAMSPFDNLDDFYAQVNWNYRDQPQFEAGGLQIAGSVGDTIVRLRNFDLGALSAEAEAVTWTQAMELNGSHLNFSIQNGMSSTWGSFGGSNMQIQVNAPAEKLNGYTTALSVSESCVTYGSNRVDMLVITEVRYYGAEGLLATDSTPKVVFELQDE